MRWAKIRKNCFGQGDNTSQDCEIAPVDVKSNALIASWLKLQILRMRSNNPRAPGCLVISIVSDLENATIIGKSVRFTFNCFSFFGRLSSMLVPISLHYVDFSLSFYILHSPAWGSKAINMTFELSISKCCT